MAARKFFCRTLFLSSFQGKSRFYDFFSSQKSLFCALRSIVKTLDWTTKFLRPNQAHVYFFIFPWAPLYVALVYLIHRWPMLEKRTKTLPMPILLAIKVVLHQNDA